MPNKKTHKTGFSSLTTGSSTNNAIVEKGGGDGGGEAKMQDPKSGNDGKVGNGGGDSSGQSSALVTTTTTDGRNDASDSRSSGVTGTNLGISLTPSGMMSATTITTTVATPFSSTNNSPTHFSTNGNTPENAENDPSADNSSSGPALVGGGNGNGSLGDGGEPGNQRSSSLGNVNSGLDSGNTNGVAGNVNDGFGSGNTNGGPNPGNGGSSSGGPDSGNRMGSGNGGIGTPGMTAVPSIAVVGSGDTNSNGGTISTGGVQEHGLPGGTIAGIVVAALVGAIAVIVILLRRRSRKRRGERRDRWWTSHDKVDGGGIGSSDGIPHEHRRSTRSSFETTVDHSLTPRLGEDLNFPSLPPMAELRGTPLLPRLDTSQSYSPSLAGRITSENRFSGATVSSTGSDGQSQWLVIGEDPFSPEASSPMSVRPFSPTESFAFPKPPTTEKNFIEGRFNLSRSSSGHTFNVRNSNYHSVAEENVPALPVRAANPFNDPDPFIIYSTAAAPVAVTPHLSGGGGASDTPLCEAAVGNPLTADPFADPEPCKTDNNDCAGSFDDEFMKIERIKRFFDPSLDDELGVVPGDKVRILQIFSDGWAMVEKNPSCGLVDVKGKGRESEQGLIPIECLRLPGMECSAASK